MTTATPPVVDRAAWEAERAALLVREKEHLRAGDAIAAARRRLPMVEVDAALPLVGAEGPTTLLAAFEGRRQLVAYFHMWHDGHPAAEQCVGCTFFAGQVTELSPLHVRDATYAVLCQGPYAESVRYRDFMGWDVPWYSAQGPTAETIVGDRPFLLACFLRDGDRVFETYDTTGRGVEAMGGFGLVDLTPYGRQEAWEDSPVGWPRPWEATGGEGTGAEGTGTEATGTEATGTEGTGTEGEDDPMRRDGRPVAQWSRLDRGRSDDLRARSEEPGPATTRASR